MTTSEDTRHRRQKRWLAAKWAALLSCGALGAGLAAAQSAPIAYVSSEGSGSVSGVDVNSLRVVKHVDVGRRPHNLDRTTNGLLVVATQGSNAVTIIDTKSEPPAVERINLGVPPHDVAVKAGGGNVFVVSERGLLAEIDAASGRVLRRIELEGQPHDVTTWDGFALVTDVSARRVFIVDGNQVRTIPISAIGHDLAVRPGSKELWITPWMSDRTVVVDLGRREQIAEFRIGRTRSHKHLSFSEDGSQAWIADPESGSLFVVDTKTGSTVATVAVGGHPHHLRVADGRVYVADGPSDLVMLDAASRKVLGRLDVGAGVHDVAITAW